VLLTGSDITSALRFIRKQPLLTATALLALATGIAMATTGFALVEAVACARLPFSGGERFVLIDVRTIPDARRADVEAERAD
jgi:predicted branched-subunit amino acid permease